MSRELQPLSPEMESLTQGFTPEGGDFIYLPDTAYPSKNPEVRQRFGDWIRTLNDQSKQSIFEIMAMAGYRKLEFGDPYFVKDSTKPPRFLKARMFVSSIKRRLTKPS